MKIYKAKLESVSAYSQSRYHKEPKLPKELDCDYEKRTWRAHLHMTEDGEVFVPPMAIKRMLETISSYLGLQIPGKGKRTYSKIFKSGLMVINPIPLGIKSNEVFGELLFLDSGGVRGGGKRVERIYPCIPKWTGTAEIVVLDDTITRDVLLNHLESGGQLTGIGRFRPENGGFYGRFEVKSLSK